MTYSEAIYICADIAKSITTDDSYITEDHIRFLLNKYRSALLKKEADSPKKRISQSNYQTICLTLELTEEDGCTPTRLRSIEKIPDILNIGSPTIYAGDYFNGDITYVSKERMRYVGYNKYLKNIIYASLGPDNHIYFTSNNPQHKFLEQVKFSGVFEDAEKANELLCDNNEDSTCNIYEQRFPLDDALFPQLHELVIRDLVGANYKPADNTNNASDDLSALASFIRQNVKSALSKQLDNNDAG